MPNRKCEAENREIPKGRRAYVVSCPGDPTIHLIGRDGLVKNVSKGLWRKGVGYRPLEEEVQGEKAEFGLNFYRPIIKKSGKVEAGELRFSVNVIHLMKFPGLFRLYFRWPNQK